MQEELTTSQELTKLLEITKGLIPTVQGIC